MVWVSVNVMVGGATTPRLVKLVENSSPLAAVHVLVPKLPVAASVQSAVTVNRPRWVALPVASRWWWLGTVPTVSKPSYVPLNGNSEPPFASVVATPPPIWLNERGWCGWSCASAGCREDTETNDYVSHVMTPSGIPSRKPVSTRCLPPRGVVMFLNSYRRRLRAAALMREIVTEKRRFGDESGGSADDLGSSRLSLHVDDDRQGRNSGMRSPPSGLSL